MPNNCWNKVRLSAHPEVIQELIDSEFSFSVICPPPNGLKENLVDWKQENWGTTRDCYDYKLEEEGKEALLIYFNTAWSPPYMLFKFLLQEHPEMWLRCDWEEEGGQAGVFVGYTQGNELVVKAMTWQDWCLEEYAHKFRKERPTNTRNHSEVSE